MKKIIISLLLSMIILFAFILLESIILSAIHLHKGIYLKDGYLNLISLITFFLVGFILGLIIKKQGLKYSLIFDLVYFVICLTYYLILKNFTIQVLITMFCKCLLFSLGSILGVNLKKWCLIRNTQMFVTFFGYNSSAWCSIN